MDNFTPVLALIGGGLIGISAVLLLGFNGRIAGISGIFFGAMESTNATRADKAWRWWFIAGLLIGAGSYLWSTPLAFEIRSEFPLSLLILSGVLVGFGTRMGSGCTSGHGVCGLARLSKRSLLATLTFLLTAILVVYIKRHILPGLSP